MNNRDPLTDPQTGDVVRSGDGSETRKVVRVCKEFVEYTFDPARLPRLAVLEAWQRWCRAVKAVVLERGK